MPARAFVTLSCLVICLMQSDAASQKTEERPIKGWGEFIDPDGDCQAKIDGTKLIITVPGTQHDLSTELKKVNAPRVLREIEGDFIADVTVGGKVRPAGQSTTAVRYPFNGAGLLLWLDDTTFVRLERAAILQEGKVVSYVLFEVRDKGRPSASPSFAIKDQPTHLRLERHDDQLFGAVSSDGVQWQSVRPIKVMGMPRKGRIGVAAISTSTQPFVAELDGLAVYIRTKE